MDKAITIEIIRPQFLAPYGTPEFSEAVEHALAHMPAYDCPPDSPLAIDVNSQVSTYLASLYIIRGRNIYGDVCRYMSNRRALAQQEQEESAGAV